MLVASQLRPYCDAVGIADARGNLIDTLVPWPQGWPKPATTAHYNLAGQALLHSSDAFTDAGAAARSGRRKPSLERYPSRLAVGPALRAWQEPGAARVRAFVAPVSSISMIFVVTLITILFDDLGCSSLSDWQHGTYRIEYA